MRLIGNVSLLVFILMSHAPAQEANIGYSSMAPLTQYLMPRDAEISLARSAAPKSISDHAEILNPDEKRVLRNLNGIKLQKVGYAW